MKGLIKRVCLPILLEKRTRKYFFADFCMEIYIMSQSALALPVFLNLMLGAYEENNINRMYSYALVWFVLSVIFLFLRYRFDILVNGIFYFRTLAEVREQCIKKVYAGSNIQIDKDFNGNGLYTFLSEEVEKFVNMMFRMTRIFADVLVILIFGIWSTMVGSGLSILVMVGSGLTLVIGNIQSKKINLKNKAIFEERSKIVGRLRSIFLGTESYLVNNQYQKVVNKYESENKQYIGETVKIAGQRAHRSNLIRWADGIVYLALIGICFVFIKNGNARIIITMISVYNTMKSYMNSLNGNVSYVIENIYVAEKYEDLVTGEMKKQESTEKNIFEADNVSYVVDGHTILDSISFELKENKKVALIGKNGSGKSTFLKILLSVLTPTEGVVRVNRNKSYAYVPVTPQLFPVTIEDNILYGTSGDTTDQLSIIEEKADLVRIGEERLKEILPDGDENLSGGEAQRVSIARAMAAQGDVLIADEPTASLDVVTTRKVFENLIDSAASVLFTTHNPELLQYADEVYMMEKGKIVCTGTYEEIFKLDIYKEWECEVMENT